MAQPIARPPRPDPLVAALARYVEALHRRYPDGPDQIRRERLACGAEQREGRRHGREARGWRSRMKRLPRSLDEIRGLRVARWVRESTAGQYDRYGPASQREQQDSFIERHGLVDTGLVFQVAQSGTTVWRSPTMDEMLEPAKAGAFDLLLAGYSDRWQRNLRRTLELLEDQPPPGRASRSSCVTEASSRSDPHDWDELVAEAAAAERYSRRLAERVTDGYAAKFTATTIRAANPPLGFRRSRSRPTRSRSTRRRSATAVGAVRALRARHRQRRPNSAARPGSSRERIRYILRNPLYNGWIRRHRGAAETAGRRRGEPTRRSRTNCGRGSRTSDAARPGAGDPRPRAGRPLGGPPRVRLRAAHPERRDIRRRSAPQAPPGAVRGMGTARPAMADETWEAGDPRPAVVDLPRRRDDRAGRGGARIDPPTGSDRAGADRTPDARRRPPARRSGDQRRGLPRPGGRAPRPRRPARCRRRDRRCAALGQSPGFG